MGDPVGRLLVARAGEDDVVTAVGTPPGHLRAPLPHLGQHDVAVDDLHDVPVVGRVPTQLAAHANRSGSPAPTRTTSG